MRRPRRNPEYMERQRIYSRVWRSNRTQEQIEKDIDNRKKWHDSNPRPRDTRTQRKIMYRLSDSEYDAIIERSNEQCEICGSVINLRMDHNHDTGKVRGMLCHRHNIGLGMFGHDQDMLKAAIKYLKERD